MTPVGLDKSVALLTMQYDKDPNDSQRKDDPAMLDWRASMGRHDRDGDPKHASNLHAYLRAQVMVHILKARGNDLSRENVMRQATGIKNLKLPLFLPPMTLNTSPTDDFLAERAQLARFTGQLWQGFG